MCNVSIVRSISSDLRLYIMGISQPYIVPQSPQDFGIIESLLWIAPSTPTTRQLHIRRLTDALFSYIIGNTIIDAFRRETRYARCKCANPIPSI